MLNSVLAGDIVASVVEKHYDIGRPTNCKLIREGFNYNYLVEVNKAKFVLRVYLNGKYYIRDADDFRFELHLLDFLLDQGLPVVRPIPNNAGEWLTTDVFEDEARHMALFHFVSGIEVDKASANGNLAPRDVERVGEVAAQIHQALDGFQTQYHRYHLDLATYLLDTPIQVFERFLSERNLGDMSFFYGYAEGLRDEFSAFARMASAYGLIHADLHGNNVFMDAEERITVIDFDHCAYGWRCYELTTWTDNEEVFATILAGYERVRTFSDLEKRLMAKFTVLRLLWDFGDWLQFTSLWGKPPTDQQLKECVQELRELVEAKP